MRDHLSPDGIFVLYNFYREPWLVQKMAGMLQSSFGSEPIVRLHPELGNTAATLANGPGIAALNGKPPPGDHIDKLTEATPRPATDDWPFLYLKEPQIAMQYLVALGVVLLWALLLIARGARRSGTTFRRFSPHFFVLGVAFLLLETRSLVTFSLLFGSTWIVNSLVFFAILASVLAAIAVNARYPIRDARPLYAALFAVIAVGYLAPPDSLLLEPAWLRYVVAGGLTFAPVFVANLVFSRSFRDTRTADMAFASNLLGAMVGGAVEYLALITGYQALLLVVAGLYALAYVFATRFRRLADRDLVDVERRRGSRTRASSAPGGRRGRRHAEHLTAPGTARHPRWPGGRGPDRPARRGPDRLAFAPCEDSSSSSLSCPAPPASCTRSSGRASSCSCSATRPRPSRRS